MIQKSKIFFLSFCLFVFIITPATAQWSNQGQNAPQNTEQNKSLEKEKKTKVEYEYKKGFDVRRIFTGGGIGLQFGTITAIDIAPMLGYNFHKMFRAGFTVRYSYYQDRRFNPVYKNSIYGGSIFARFYPLKYLFIHAEGQIINQEIWNTDGTDERRSTVLYPLAGIGYNQPLGQRAGLFILLLWNFNDVHYSIYNNPILQLGFDIGI